MRNKSKAFWLAVDDANATDNGADGDIRVFACKPTWVGGICEGGARERYLDGYWEFCPDNFNAVCGPRFVPAGTARRVRLVDADYLRSLERKVKEAGL